jgi:hypothetical protein
MGDNVPSFIGPRTEALEGKKGVALIAAEREEQTAAGGYPGHVERDERRWRLRAGGSGLWASDALARSWMICNVRGEWTMTPPDGITCAEILEVVPEQRALDAEKDARNRADLAAKALHALDKAESDLASVRAKLTDCQEALSELVRLKDRKIDGDPLLYSREVDARERAWALARRVLSSRGSEGIECKTSADTESDQ